MSTTPLSSADLKRRSFLRAAFTGAVITPGILSAAEVEKVIAQSDDSFNEPARDLPLVEDTDVIVCGAGPAGIAAAITAARAGARVRLFEWRGCLGGVWTAGLLGYFLDFDKPGIAKELRDRLDARDARANSTSARRFCYDPEALKMLLEEMCVEAGVKFQFHTRVAAAYREGRKLTTVVTESKSGRQAWSAPVFIDTTGDGDLGAHAGCNFEIGEAKDCPCQPMSLNALLMVKDVEALREFVRFGKPNEGENTDSEKKKRIKDVIVSTGHFPSYAGSTLWHIRGNLIFAMLNHEYGIKPWDAAEITAATVRARAEMNKMVNGLRSLGGPWEGIQIVATAEQIGVRDGRRIMGRFTVTEEDLVKGARYDDGVTRATFGVDVHATSAEHNQNKAPIHVTNIKVKPYDIPLRALIAKDVDGLMMAGRCISGDFISHSSYRVTGNAVSMGEAAGVVAAIAATTKRMPHDVAWSEGEAKLKEIGHRA
ncbi:FAD dependent oxidoreductase [Prosthecobacter fusiformis]|uniref:FAD dependent oxidoreductase n=1 Tax=Prosthecobacter fusiformis TaxID=48464 RepID=A0A4R7SRD2_9BACT|nr:FAD-dependent oxidoreductase [Prosthecobacter fusiformis]TDU81006.1 FAD dependent oxidoreductase [Prosthecobacter fusiformis]